MNNKNGLEIHKHSKFLYTMTFNYDYGLDDMLACGIHNTAELARFVQKRFSLKNRPLYNNINAGCTTFNFTDENSRHCLARNFDYKNGPCIVLKTNPPHGYKSVSVACMNCMLYGFHHFSKPGASNRRLFLAPYACMDGINEKGLAIAVLQIKAKPTKQGGSNDAITTTVAIRAVLDTCSTVSQAIDFFKTHSMNDALGRNYHYQIADASGKTAVIEYVDNSIRVFEDKPYYHVENFYLSHDGKEKHGVGYTRAKWLNDAFDENNNRISEAQAMDLLKKVKLFYRHRRGYIVQTLWSATYNCSNKTMNICVGSDFDKTYTFSV